MKVIVNASGYVGQSGGAGGAGVFLQYLISGLTETCDVDVLVAANSKNFRGHRSAARFIEVPYLAPDTLRHLRSGPTVVLDPFGGLPCAPFPDDMALCVIVHDLMHLERPHFFTAPERADRSVGFAGGLQRADAVVTFSADQARAIRQYYPGSHPTVIPHLPYMTLTEPDGSGAEAALPQGLGKFMLFPGVKWPHKNHKTVIEAFNAYVKRSGSNLRLVMCGGPCSENRFSFIPPNETFSKQIVDLGRVSNEVLTALFANAEAVLFPTLYEGFGIPVLEAAYLGKMVVASGLPVFDEILGEANYRRVSEPLCGLRWMEAFADVEGSARALYEKRTHRVQERVNAGEFLGSFIDVLKSAADRYTLPSLYPARQFPSGDRATSSLVTQLNFVDIYGSATSDRGTRQAGLGVTSAALASYIFRSSGASRDARETLRANYNVPAAADDKPGNLQFHAWVRLLGNKDLAQLNWSANDQGVFDILPDVKDGEWHLVRAAVPHSGFIDFRGVRDGKSEVADFDLEIHDPCILRQSDMPVPRDRAPPRTLTILVAALTKTSALSDVVPLIGKINASLRSGIANLQWIVVCQVDALGEGYDAGALPANVRVHVVATGRYARNDAIGLIPPYQQLSQILLLEAANLSALLEATNLGVLTSAFGPSPISGQGELTFGKTTHGFWLPEEHGRILDLSSRIGQPIPPLDPKVIQACLTTETAKQRPRFAVIETDRTSNISHHGTVSSLFLDGAEELGFQPVLGINHSAATSSVEGIETWAGFSAQVYAVGNADSFTDELEKFIAEMKLGPEDIVFIHSLSPQILLGAARYIAANPALSPRFAMRFFSTAEAMTGHRISYTKILRSIEAVQVVRQRMHFFCESANLIEYYADEVGPHYPLLFNPEHPSLALVRDSDWLDPTLGGGTVPTLAYFGEAREEKGFDEIPGIVTALLEAESMSAFRFLIQTGSNSGNDTPKMARAKAALIALKTKYPDRLRTFESVETPEQFYFLMKHSTGVIAPYQATAYAKRGTGVTLEALQMGLDVFAWTDTDLYATFRYTGRVVGVEPDTSFADAIVGYYAAGAQRGPVQDGISLNQSPKAVCERLLASCISPEPTGRLAPPILWVGNDTLGEGCSAVYSAQKRALRELRRDCLELFVPWPDPNWQGVEPGAYDVKIYGFDSLYESFGLAWIAKPTYSPKLRAMLREIEHSGPTFRRLRDLNENFSIPAGLKQSIANNHIEQTLLNYAHLYPVIAATVPFSQVTCETHDIVAYQHAVRRGDAVSVSEKIDEFSDLSYFPKIIAISQDEQREMAGACASSSVYWRLPPFLPEPEPTEFQSTIPLTDLSQLTALGGIPDDIATPSRQMLSSYYARPDLRPIFQLNTPAGRQAFFRWWFLFGQFEERKEHHFSTEQLDWLLGHSTSQESPQLGGMLAMFLSVREDLRKAFISERGIDFDALNAWADANAEREFNLSARLLTERAAHRANPTQSSGGSVMRAVLDADPSFQKRSKDEVEGLLEQIADVPQIDLALVGSSHPSNIESFRWFLSEVFLKYFSVRGRNVFVVGSVCEQLRDIESNNIFLLGRCERVGPILKASSVCPLPVVVGSGSPIKTIPALALNGAVTVTDHIERAFGLEAYGIPAFSEPREFADDIWSQLTDPAFRADRQARSHKYVEDNLTFEGYTEFWGKLLAW